MTIDAPAIPPDYQGHRPFRHFTFGTMSDAATDTIYPPSPSTPTMEEFGVASTVNIASANRTDLNTTTVTTPAAAATTMIAPSSPPEETPPPHIPMYQSTGIQTGPQPNSAAFVEVYGREPHVYQYEHNLGMAGIGRYTTTGPAPHDVTRSAKIPIPEASPKVEYVSSSFATLKFRDCKQALTLAKTRASIQAARPKWKKLAAEQGFKLWSEKREHKIIHSEQFAAKDLILSRLNDEGQVKDGEDVGYLLPNVYKDDLKKDSPTVAPTATHATHLPSPSTTPSKLTKQVAKPIEPVQPVAVEASSNFQPIPSLEPEDRGDPPDPQDPEESEYDPAYEPDAIHSFALHIPTNGGLYMLRQLLNSEKPRALRRVDRSSQGSVSKVRRNSATSARATAPTPAPSATPSHAPSQVPTGPRSTKRKDRREDRDDKDSNRERRVKRSRAISPSPERHADRDTRHRGEDPRHTHDTLKTDRHASSERQRSWSRESYSPPTTHEFRSPSPVPGSHHKSSANRAEQTHRKDDLDDDRRGFCRKMDCRDKRRGSRQAEDYRDDYRTSRHRSRSPGRSRKASKEVYRVMDKSSMRDRERDTDRHYSSRNDDQHEGRHVDSPRTHTAQDSPNTGSVKGGARAPVPLTSGKKDATVHDVSRSRPRQSMLSESTAPPLQDTDPVQALIDSIVAARENATVPEPPQALHQHVETSSRHHEPPQETINKVERTSDYVQKEPVKEIKTSEAEKPMLDHREHDKDVISDSPQRRAKRGREGAENSVNEDTTPQKKAKIEVEQSRNSATKPVGPAKPDHETQHAATAAPPQDKQTVPNARPKQKKPKRAEIARFQPRVQRTAQNSHNTNTNRGTARNTNNYRER